MIQHKIEGCKNPVLHVEEVELNKEEVSRIRRLLSIENMEELSEEEKQELGCKEDDCEYIFVVEFDDGATLDWKLCSGTVNYFDDVLLKLPNFGWQDLDCTFELDDIEIDAESDIYQVKLVIT